MNVKARAAFTAAAKAMAVVSTIVIISMTAKAAPNGADIASKVKTAYESLKTVSLIAAIEYKEGKNLMAMKASVITGMTHPVLRRIASSTSTINAMPNAMSHGSGEVLRSVKSSPPRIM